MTILFRTGTRCVRWTVQSRNNCSSVLHRQLPRSPGNVLIDTHASVKTPKGYLAGLPEWVLREIMPDCIVLVETDDDQILMRRMTDETRSRDKEGSRSIGEHQQFNRSIAAAYAMLTGCTIKIVINADFLLERAAEDMAAVLR